MPSLKRPPLLAATVFFVLLAILPIPHAVREIAAVLALACAAAAAWTPRTALVMLVVYLPFRVLVEAMAPTPITFLPDVMVLALVVRVLVLHPSDVLPLDLIEIAALLFGAWGLLASVHAHAPKGAAVLEVRDLLLFVVLYAAARRLRRTGDGLDDAWWSRVAPYALGAVAVDGLQGMLQTFVLGHDLLLPGKLMLSQAKVVFVNVGRPYGWLDNPNVFGELGFLAMIIAYDHFRKISFRPVWLFATAEAFFALMVILSFSRSAYIVVLVAAAIFIYGVRGRERLAIGAAIAAMAVTVALIPGARVRAVFGRVPKVTTVAHHTTHKGHHHAGTGTGKTPKTTPTPPPKPKCGYLCTSNRAGRLHNLKVALKLVRHHPFGTGLGTFGSAGALAFHVRLPYVPKNFYADNQYTVVLVETGLPGALLFGLLGLAAFLAILRRRRPASAHSQRFLLAVFVGMTILGATSNAWEQLVLTLYPWLVLSAFLAEPPGPPAAPERAQATA